MTIRVGILGFGYTASYLYEQLRDHPEWGLQTAFVTASRRAEGVVLPELYEPDIARALERPADLIVEAAHADLLTQHAATILRRSSLMPLSLTALAHDGFYDDLVKIAGHAGTCLYLPHGAALGLDSLSECADLWEEVTVTMVKPPANLDFTACDAHREGVNARTTLYDGPTRGICHQFPRNVNSHAAVALAGIGLDRTRSILVADPAATDSTMEILARGNGVEMRLQRRNPLKGVTGVMTVRSLLGSVLRAKAPGLAVQVC